MEKKRLIVVLGMHRSGTSTIARALQTMQVSLGDKLMAPAAGDNPKGFFEDTEIYALNVEILRALQSEWFSLVPVSANDVQMLRERGYFLRAVDLVQSKAGGPAVFALKDPRIAKLLPFWDAVFRQCRLKVSYVVAVRHPRSVAQSLAKRNGFDLERGYLLWLDHVVKILPVARAAHAVFVDYDRLIDTPIPQVERLAKALDLSVYPVDLAQYTGDFLEQELRHSLFTPDDLAADAGCPPLVGEIHAAMVEQATAPAGAKETITRGRLHRWTQEYERLHPTLSYVDRLVILNDGNAQAVKALSAQVDSLTAETVARGHWGQGLNQTVAERDAMIAGLTEQIGQIEDALRTADAQRVQVAFAGAQNERAMLEEQFGHFRKSALQVQALQAEMLQLQAHWAETSEQHQQEAARERSSLLGRLEVARRTLQDAEEAHGQELAARQRRDVDLELQHATNQHATEMERLRLQLQTESSDARESELQCRLVALQDEVQAMGQQWPNILAAQREESASERATLTRRAEELQAQIQDRALRERDLAVQLASAQGSLLGLAAAQERLQAQERDQAATMLEHATQMSAMQGQLRQQEQQLAEEQRLSREQAHAAQSAHAAALAELRSALDGSSVNAKQWQEAYEASRKQFTALVSSAMWRVTRPLRAMAESLGLTAPVPTVDPPLPYLPLPLPFFQFPMTQSSMSKSPAAKTAPDHVRDLLRLYDEQFVHAAYMGVLRRHPDSEGRDYYLGRLRSGVDKLEILNQLRSSREGRPQANVLAGLDDAIQRHLAQKPPAWKAL